MKQKVVSIGDINVANDLPFVLFGGMNVLESRDLAISLTCSKPLLTKPTAPPSTLIVDRAWKKG